MWALLGYAALFLTELGTLGAISYHLYGKHDRPQTPPPAPPSKGQQTTFSVTHDGTQRRSQSTS